MINQDLTLNERCAYHRRLPIISHEQLPRPVLCEPMDQEWKEYLNQNKWWAKAYVKDPLQEWDKKELSHIQKLLQFRDRLLQFGGEEVCLPRYEEDLENIHSRGQFWYGDRFLFMKGRPSQCHANSCNLYEANKNNDHVELHIVTGYALSSDGMWRQHTWLVQVRPRINRIIETTEPRVAYFGFVLTDHESKEFCGNHF